MPYPDLDRIRKSEDVRRLSHAEIGQLIKEIRAFLIENVTKTGGHLASNLGVVELTVALHRIFDIPGDRIIFDVGHQSYVHKILTGRKDEFDTLRQSGGLSGFPRPAESEADPFVSGHSSTSLSLAVGFAEADRLRGESHRNIAVIGDGAFTGGMIHEALNNCRKNDRLIVILNENEMSIGANIGGFAKHLSRMRSTDSYFKFKDFVRKAISKIPLVGGWLTKRVTRVKKNIKSLLYKSNYFEDLGFTYLGPVNGNEYDRVELLLSVAKRLNENVVIHLKTKKGCGYAPAEENPSAYHCIAPANACTAPGVGTFSSAFGDWICERMKEDERLAAITAAMADGTGLSHAAECYPDRFFDVGIAEEHAVTFAAGLSAGGLLPVFAVYSTFLQRGYDSLIHDVGILSKPVIFAIDRAGFNEADGVTHNGIFDVSYLSAIHGFSLWSPATCKMLRADFDAALTVGGPAAVRYPKGQEISLPDGSLPGEGGDDALLIRSPLSENEESRANVVIATYGTIAAEAFRSAEKLAADGIRCDVILMNRILPYEISAEALCKYLPDDFDLLCFLEEGVRQGGASVNWCDALTGLGALRGTVPLICAVEDPFLPGESGKTMRQVNGIDADSIADKIRARIAAH